LVQQTKRKKKKADYVTIIYTIYHKYLHQHLLGYMVRWVWLRFLLFSDIEFLEKHDTLTITDTYVVVSHFNRTW